MLDLKPSSVQWNAKNIRQVVQITTTVHKPLRYNLYYLLFSWHFHLIPGFYKLTFKILITQVLDGNNQEQKNNPLVLIQNCLVRIINYIWKRVFLVSHFFCMLATYCGIMQGFSLRILSLFYMNLLKPHFLILFIYNIEPECMSTLKFQGFQNFVKQYWTPKIRTKTYQIKSVCTHCTYTSMQRNIPGKKMEYQKV